MARVARFVSGRRTKWMILVLWVVLVLIARPLGAKVQDIVDDRQEAFLPKDAQSTEVIKLQKSEFRGGDTVNGLVVYERPGGLRPADLRKLAVDARAAAQKLPVVAGTPTRPLVSPDRSLAYFTLKVPNSGDQDRVVNEGKELRDVVGDGGGGLKVYV